MCLAIPAKVISVEGASALVAIEDLEYQASLLLLDDVRPGDFVMLHAGFAIEKVDRRKQPKPYGFYMKLQTIHLINPVRVKNQLVHAIR